MGMNITQMPCNPGNYTEKRTGANLTETLTPK